MLEIAVMIEWFEAAVSEAVSRGTHQGTPKTTKLGLMLQIKGLRGLVQKSIDGEFLLT